MDLLFIPGRTQPSMISRRAVGRLRRRFVSRRARTGITGTSVGVFDRCMSAARISCSSTDRCISSVTASITRRTSISATVPTVTSWVTIDDQFRSHFRRRRNGLHIDLRLFWGCEAYADCRGRRHLDVQGISACRRHADVHTGKRAPDDRRHGSAGKIPASGRACGTCERSSIDPQASPPAEIWSTTMTITTPPKNAAESEVYLKQYARSGLVPNRKPPTSHS